jgi:hypothetical protein
MGDFNADFHRNNRFDGILKKFIKDNDMIILDHINNIYRFLYNIFDKSRIVTSILISLFYIYFFRNY